MVPHDMRQVGEAEFLITWEDGHRSLYPYDYLRLNCRCAQCCDEWSGKRLIYASSIPKDIKPLETVPVGRYAVRFNWSDGHVTGIYSFDFLRELCPCEACRKNREEQLK